MIEQVAFNIKVDKKDLDDFRKTAKKYDRKATDVMRELIAAYAEQRVTITPTKSQVKQQEEVYES